MPLKNILTPVFIIMALSIGKANAQIQSEPGDSLNMYRKQIDSLDSQVIQLLGKRMEIVESIGVYKVRHNIPPLQQARFDLLLKRNIETGKRVNLSETFITEMMNAIHKESLQKEEEIKAASKTH